MPTEFELLNIVRHFFPRIKDSRAKCGIGDDAAVFKCSSAFQVWTSDSLEEGIHFTRNYSSPDQIAGKLLAVNLSDIAAMAAIPRFALLSVSYPRNLPILFFKKFCESFAREAKKYHVSLLGGDTDIGSQKLRFTLSLLGETKKPLYRSGALLGDRIYISGYPGYSALGLYLLKKNLASSRNLFFKQATRHHLSPTPRLKLAQHLGRLKEVHSLIDVSDGVLIDLSRLLDASLKGAHIDLTRLSFPQPLNLKLSNSQIQKLIWTGGEDYELLWTADQHFEKKVEAVSKQHQIPIHCIGEVTDSKKYSIFKEKKFRSLLKS